MCRTTWWPTPTSRDEVIANITTLIDKARAEQVPVIWVQHSDDDLPEDSDGWQYVPELQRQESEPLVHKKYGDSFEDTTLESELAQRGVGRLVVTGAQTDACIRATIHGAFTRGYDTLLVSDAHTTEDLSEYGLPPADKVIAHTNMYWTLAGGPRTHGQCGRDRRCQLRRGRGRSLVVDAISAVRWYVVERSGHGE